MTRKTLVLTGWIAAQCGALSLCLGCDEKQSEAVPDGRAHSDGPTHSDRPAPSEVRVAAETPKKEGDDAVAATDASKIDLLPLSEAILSAVDLPGELACSFAKEKGASLLLARANSVRVGDVVGVVNDGGKAHRVMKVDAKGGFGALLDGITLTGDGLTIELARGQEIPTGHEGSRHEAQLTVLRDGEKRTYTGVFSCGP